MKVSAIVALLGLTVGASAFAVPFTPNDTTPSVINPAPAGEQSLQTIADNLFGTGAINVNTGQSSSAFFTSTTPSAATSIPTMVAEFTANASTQIFGIWFGTDTDHLATYDLLYGGATVGNDAAISLSSGMLNVGSTSSGACGLKVNCGSFSNSLINPTSFGFYFKPASAGPTYYTLDQLNPGPPHQDRVVSFEAGTSSNWLFAYEDGTDFDYNDMAVKVESIAPAVPEPETYALMLAGFAALGFMGRRRNRAAK